MAGQQGWERQLEICNGQCFIEFPRIPGEEGVFDTAKAQQASRPEIKFPLSQEVSRCLTQGGQGIKAIPIWNLFPNLGPDV